MSARALSFDQVLDATEKLPTEDQAALVAILKRRLAERGRRRLVADIRAARKEMKAGRCKPTSVDDLMDEIES